MKINILYGFVSMDLPQMYQKPPVRLGGRNPTVVPDIWRCHLTVGNQRKLLLFRGT